jgi:molybdopterin converting factor small subunit
MSSSTSANASAGTVTVRYWASARAAAGVDADRVEVGSGTTLAELFVQVRALHPDRPTLPGVLAVCSALVGDRPVGATDPADVKLLPGDVVELLPPFAGG